MSLQLQPEWHCLHRLLRCYVFLTLTVHVTDYHWDRHLYFVIHSYHAQTMTRYYSLLVHLLVVSVARDSD
jgi:hypothetical protein